jgi:hypothetical protein
MGKYHRCTNDFLASDSMEAAMSEMRRLGLVDALLLIAVLAVAAGARCWYLSAFTDNGLLEGPVRVQDQSPAAKGREVADQPPLTEQQSLLKNLRESAWFGAMAPLAAEEESTAHLSPGYPWSIYWLERLPLGGGPIDQRVRWFQCLLGVATVGFYFAFTLTAFASRFVAILAGLLCALHPFWIINTAEIQDGVLASFLLAACLWLGTRASQTGGAFPGLLFGLGLAALALVRAALFPFTLVALLGFLWRVRGVGRGWLCALLAVLGFVNGLAPWTFRNYKVFSDVVPIADSTWLHLWVGNNSHTTGGPQSADQVLSTLAEERGMDAAQLAQELESLPQNERYEKLARDVTGRIQRDAAGAINHRLEAMVCFLLGEKWLIDRTVWEATGRAAPELRGGVQNSYPALLYGSLLIMTTLGLLGWRWSYAWRRSSILPAVAVMFLPLPYVLSHAELLSGPRLPLDGLMLCFAAFALTCLIPGLAPPLFCGPAAIDEREGR